MSDRYVVDANVVIKLFVDEDLSETARTLLGRMGNPEPDEFYAPDLLFAECGNVLWKYVRFHGYDPQLARENLSDLTDLALQIVPTAELVSDAFELGNLYGITVYDACYFALAQRLTLPLVTADEKLVKHLERTKLPIQFLGDVLT